MVLPTILRNIVKNIIVLSSLLISIQVFSQKFEMKIDSILNLEIAELKTNGVTEVGYTKLTCINYGIYSTVYLIWTKDNSTFVQKFKDMEYDNKSLQKFQPIKVNDSAFFAFYKQNKEKLNNENIEPFEYQPDSIAENKTYSYRLTTSHSCFRNFIIKSDKENFHKYFDYFNLNEFDNKKFYASKRKFTQKEIKEWEERGWIGMDSVIIHENFPKRNLNFDSNKKLKLVEWDNIITKFIQKLESENKLELIETE